MSSSSLNAWRIFSFFCFRYCSFPSPSSYCESRKRIIRDPVVPCIARSGWWYFRTGAITVWSSWSALWILTTELNSWIPYIVVRRLISSRISGMVRSFSLPLTLHKLLPTRCTSSPQSISGPSLSLCERCRMGAVGSGIPALPFPPLPFQWKKATTEQLPWWPRVEWDARIRSVCGRFIVFAVNDICFLHRDHLLISFVCDL